MFGLIIPPVHPQEAARRYAEEQFQKFKKETTVANDLVTEEQAKRYTTLTITVPDFEEVVDSDGFQTHATIGGGFAFVGLLGYLAVCFPMAGLVTFLVVSGLAVLGAVYFLVWMMVTDLGYRPVRWWPKKTPKK